jgi:hypothetical protein
MTDATLIQLISTPIATAAILAACRWLFARLSQVHTDVKASRVISEQTLGRLDTLNGSVAELKQSDNRLVERVARIEGRLQLQPLDEEGLPP